MVDSVVWIIPTEAMCKYNLTHINLTIFCIMSFCIMVWKNLSFHIALHTTTGYPLFMNTVRKEGMMSFTAFLANLLLLLIIYTIFSLCKSE